MRDAKDFDIGALMTSNSAQLSSRPFGISAREPAPDTSIVSIEGELDLSAAPRLKWMLVDLLESGRTRLVVDLSLASFMDSTALGVLLGVKRRLKGEERLAIVCARPNVLKIFEFAGVDGAFAIFPTLDGALAYVQGPSSE
ncbi:MAG: STAS domain-containing protein [Solirubrobacteraceae bacterium]